MEQTETTTADAAFSKAAEALRGHREWYTKLTNMISAYATMPMEQKLREAHNGSPSFSAICDELCKSPGVGETLLDGGIETMARCHNALHQEMNSMKAQFAVLIKRLGGDAAEITIAQSDLNEIAGRALLQKGDESALTYKLVDDVDTGRVH